MTHTNKQWYYFLLELVATTSSFESFWVLDGNGCSDWGF